MSGIEERINTRTTQPPSIVENKDNPFVIVGSVDHGHKIPDSAIPTLIKSLEGITALKMEASSDDLKAFHPMSTEVLVKASAGNVPILQLPGCSFKEEIGEQVIKYAPEHIAEAYVPWTFVRYNREPPRNLDTLFRVIDIYRSRFEFIDMNRCASNFLKITKYWDKQGLDFCDLDKFSYDFEKFVGDIREFEFWAPDLKRFRKKHKGKIAVCCGDYHVSAVKDILEGRELKTPSWKNHIDEAREDLHSKIDKEELKIIYAHLENAIYH